MCLKALTPLLKCRGVFNAYDVNPAYVRGCVPNAHACVRGCVRHVRGKGACGCGARLDDYGGGYALGAREYVYGCDAPN